MNLVVLKGNLCSDVDFVQVGSKNTPKASFRLAVNRYISKDRRDTLYISVQAWNKNAEIINSFLKKGDPVLIEGHLRQDTWQDDSGKNRSVIYVVIDKLHLMPKNGKKASSNTNSVSTSNSDPFSFVEESTSSNEDIMKPMW